MVGERHGGGVQDYYRVIVGRGGQGFGERRRVLKVDLALCGDDPGVTGLVLRAERGPRQAVYDTTSSDSSSTLPTGPSVASTVYPISLDPGV